MQNEEKDEDESGRWQGSAQPTAGRIQFMCVHEYEGYGLGRGQSLRNAFLRVTS